MSAELRYFYGNEADSFTFYRIPKILFKEKAFKGISIEAKVLYGLMLDRMSLSVKNKWFDEEDRVYIIYTIEDIIEDLGCARQKAAKLLDELDRGVGLIERKRQGLGKANIIYVKNFSCNDAPKEPENSKNLRVWKSNLQKYENQTSGSMISELQEVRKSNSNNTDINYTDFSDTEIVSYPISSLFPFETASPKNPDAIRWMEKRKAYEEIIKENISYNIISEQYEKTWLDEIVAVMVDVVCSDDEYIRINKKDFPKEAVKNRFLKIDDTHIEYIYLSLKENTSDVRNIRAFLITTIYRAFETSDNWYMAKVNHDLYGSG